MPKSIREYHRPTDLTSAQELLRRPNLVPLLLGPRVPDHLYSGAEAVLDLSRLALDRITELGLTVQIGSLTTLQTVADSEILAKHLSGLVSDAARQAVPSGLRQATTMGGVLLARDGPPDVLLALLMCGAEVIVQGEQRRKIDLADFLAADQRLLPGELIVGVVITGDGGHGGGALVRIARAPRDEMILGAAAALRVVEGRCRSPRLGLAGVGARPYRVASVEKLIDHQTLTPEVLATIAQIIEAEVTPSTDFRASAEYRRAMAGVLVRRALETAWQRSLEHH